MTTRPPGFPLTGAFFKPWKNWPLQTSVTGKLMTVPPVNIMENDDHYVLTLAVPGLKKEDLKIALDGRVLSISTEKDEREKAEETFTRREFDFFSFSRSFSLPEDVQAELIDASYQAGLLRIVLPRKKEVKRTTASRQIAVQ